MRLEKEQGEKILHAISDAIRFYHLDGKDENSFFIRDLIDLHWEIRNKVYRSKEMRIEHMLPMSIRKGTDVGTVFCRERIEKNAKRA